MIVEKRLAHIAAFAIEKEEENVYFRSHIKSMDATTIDEMAYELNKVVSAVIDCTTCGNCCNKLVINVEPEDAISCANGLGLPKNKFIEQYIEVSEGGKYFINTIPCHFLSDKKCTIYPHRFTDCREFPHLHKPGFKERLLGTLLHYGNCPIIYNVIEEMKLKTGFVVYD